ncbi:hypothetical protein HW532_17155 [Kaustia mangrovi]|uniref:ASCH domain-containing protein n=1 Tax=Kaustia mangrovi TaxID=2593653 RepID=A0A7S8C6K6_9HYPH|nr:ASCH domain-containing protein [Kaustia mangrovi]QPC44271.1 hypothetical protein HW532_17155 [Kaustia mangrovi]
MLFKKAVLDRIAAGRVTVAFRYWRRPTVRAGGRLRTAVGELAIDSVERVEETDIGPADARAAGYGTPDALRRDLTGGEGRQLYRIAFHLEGPDERMALRDMADLPDGELETLRSHLRRMDRRAPWTHATLRLIAQRPATAAAILADTLGRDRLALKRDIRKLKELGLTESLDVGYRLSPRGEAYLSLAGEDATE